MGRKIRLGRIHKNNERNRQKKGINKVGRPAKKVCMKTLVSCVSQMTLPCGWVNQSTHNSIMICKLESAGVGHPPTIVKSLCILLDYSWKVYAHGRLVNIKECSALKSFPAQISSPSLLRRIVLRLDSLSVCAGNPDSHFIELAGSKRGGVFLNSCSEPIASVDDYFPVSIEGVTYKTTIRTVKCEVLVNGVKCESCKDYRPTLRSLHSKWLHKTSTMDQHTQVSSHTNYRYLTSPEKHLRMANLKNEVDRKRRELEKLKSRLDKMTEEEGIDVDDDLCEDLASIIEKETDYICEKHEVDTFPRLFWEQQAQAARLKNKRQMRWHPMFIKWCLSLKFISSGSYKALRSSNVIVLPSDRTLRDYTHFVKARVGFHHDLDKELLREAKLGEIASYQNFVCLIFDEMKIKEDLVYDKHSGQLIGFMNIGDVNNQLLQLEQECKQAEPKKKLATHMLTFMVRGLLSGLDFPYASFPCVSLGGEQLYSIVWGAVRRLEACGFRVVALTCDGASCNRNFFRMHKELHSHDEEEGHEGSLIYKTRNPFSIDERSIFFISDPPHLLKTVRNCWANSHAHSLTRTLWIHGHDISWQHLVSLYEKYRGKGLSILDKLKWEHIHLTSYSKMRVDLAAQVLSTTVATAFEYDDNPETIETERFVRYFDKFFDLMNVRSLDEGIKKRKPNLLPYRETTDERLLWLEEDFLSYLEEWDRCVEEIDDDDVSASDKARMRISQETLEGLRFTVKAFVELSRYLLSQPGVKYFLSEKLSQDTVECFFGRQRMRGGYNDNPNVSAFLYGANSLRVQGSSAVKVLRGNCRRKDKTDDSPLPVDHTPIPKRQSK